MTLDEFELLIENKLPVADKALAFPNGLYLSKVEYPYVTLKEQLNIYSFLKKGLEN